MSAIDRLLARIRPNTDPRTLVEVTYEHFETELLNTGEEELTDGMRIAASNLTVAYAILMAADAACFELK